MPNYASLLLGGKVKKSMMKGKKEECSSSSSSESEEEEEMMGAATYLRTAVSTTTSSSAAPTILELGSTENVGKGMRRKLKGKMTSEKMEEMGMMGGKMGKNGYEVKGGDMSFMKNSMHTGMDMPTKEEFIKGGKMHSMKVKSEDNQVNVPEAIKHLGMLASKFGLRLIK